MTRWESRIKYCVNLQDTAIIAPDVKAEIGVFLKVLALKVHLQPQGSFSPNEVLQEAEPSKVA